MARKDLAIAILSFLVMTIGYTNIRTVPMQYRFLLKFIVYSACYAMLLSWLRLRQRAKGATVREGYREILKFSVFYVSVLMIIELPGILVEIATVKI